MFGTASDTFGEGRFGHADWGLITVYNSMPRMHRQLDANIGSPLRKLFKTIEDEMEQARLAIGDLPNQRDPIEVRSGGATVFDISAITDNADGTSTVTLTKAHDFDAGNEVAFAGVTTGTPIVVGKHTIKEVPSPFNALLDTQFTITKTLSVNASDGRVKLWDRRSTLVEVESFREYTDAYQVDQKDGPMVELTLAEGVDLELIGVGYVAELVLTTPISPSAPSSGQASVSQYSFKVLRITRRNDPEARDVLLCEGRPFLSTDPLPSPITLNFVQPSLLFQLTKDFGIEPDDNLPTSLQRSGAKNVVEIVKLKASERGYQLRSEQSGFFATVQGLFSLCEDPGLPEAKIYNIDGRMYTDIEPKGPLFDDLAADIEGIDYETGATIYVTDLIAFKDSTRPFGESPLMSFFNRIFSLQITSTAPVPQSVLTSLGIPYGQYINGTILAADRELIGDPGNGRFSITGPHTGPPVPPTGFNPDNLFHVEHEVSYNPGTGAFQWIVGLPTTVTIPLPTSPTEYYLKYDPPVSEDCCWCKSHVVRILLEPTPAFLASGTYTGAQVTAAINRLIERIKSEQLPAHARIGEVALAQSIAVNWPSVTVTVSVT